MRIYLSIFCLAFSQLLLGQSVRLDSLIQKFLLENKEVDTIFHNEKKVGNKVIVESNYFKTRIVYISLKKCVIAGYEFGSNSSFRKRFILIDVIDGSSHRDTFFGKEGIDNDFRTMRDILCSNECVLMNADKKRLITAMMKIYVDILLNGDCNQYEQVL
jgi:hypothetical protein